MVTEGSLYQHVFHTLYKCAWQVSKYLGFSVDFQRPWQWFSWLVFCTPGICTPLQVEPEEPQERMMGQEQPHTERQELPGLGKEKQHRLGTTRQTSKSEPV